MSVWILIVFLKIGYGGGPTQIETKSSEECQRVAKEIRDSKAFNGYVTDFLCVEVKK